MPRPDFTDANDADLLACFAAGRDEGAFAEIVRRHGPMVMGVAQRRLRQTEDAEDAFQATFLALARAAGRCNWRPCVGAWLHQAVIRTVRSIGRMNAHWYKKIENQKAHAKEAYAERNDNELAYVVDEELRRLPIKYREAVVLCDLEGLTRKEAATRLIVPLATVSTRLTRGRNLLRTRLVRRGVTGVGLAAAMTKSSTSAAISPALINQTTTNALQFASGKATEIGVSTTITQAAQGVITAMKMTKFAMISLASLSMVVAAASIGEVASTLSAVAHADTIFRDTFDVPSPEDLNRQPISWYNNLHGTISIMDGDFIISGNGLAGRGIARDLSLQDVSVRTQFKGAVGTLAFIQVRFEPGNNSSVTGYASLLTASGEAAIIYTGDDFSTRLASSTTDLRPSEEDVLLQVDAIGSNIDVYAWRPTEPRPNQPTVSLVDDGLLRPGTIAIGVGPSDSTETFDGRFRFVHVSSTSIPEPSTVALSAILFAGIFVWQWRRRW